MQETCKTPASLSRSTSLMNLQGSSAAFVLWRALQCRFLPYFTLGLVTVLSEMRPGTASMPRTKCAGDARQLNWTQTHSSNSLRTFTLRIFLGTLQSARPELSVTWPKICRDSHNATVPAPARPRA